MNQHTRQEARRVLAVVDGMIDDLQILSHLPPHLSAVPTRDLQHIMDSFPDEEGASEVQLQLTEHYDLERRLDAAVAQAVGGAQPMVAGLPAVSAEMSQEDISDLHLSTRTIIDTLRHAGYPECDGFRPTFPESQNIKLMLETVTALRALLYDRLTTSVEDDVAKFSILNETVNREKTASADVQALNREYATVKEQRRVEVEERNQMIRALREELAAVQEGAEVRHSEFSAAAAEHEEADAIRHQQNFDELAQQVEELEKEIDSVSLKCYTAESQLRQLRNKKETALSQIISHYDEEMTAGTVAVEGLQDEIDKDEAKLVDVEGDLDELNHAADAYDAEVKLDRERVTHAAVVQSRQKESARVIQAFFRSHAMRLDVANRGKKKGKKGKKGGK